MNSVFSLLIRHILFDKVLKHNAKNPNRFLGGADSTTDNWKIMYPFKISAKAGIRFLILFQIFEILDARFRGHDKLRQSL